VGVHTPRAVGSLGSLPPSAAPHTTLPLPLGDLCAAFATARRRVVILDYGGTLIERSATVGRTESFGNRADFHTDGYGQQLPAPVLSALGALASDASTTLYVVSGLRTSAVLELQVSQLPGVGLAAEYGLMLSHSNPFAWEREERPGSPRRTPESQHSPVLGAPLPAVASPGVVPPTVASPGAGGSPPTISTGLFRERSSRGLVGVRPSLQPSPALASGSSAAAAPPLAEDSRPREWTRASLESVSLAEWGAVKRCVCTVMADYEGRVNGSVLREYDSLVAWDFRAVDAEWALGQARFLIEDIERALKEGGADGSFSGASALENCAITLRKTRVEVCLRCINKGRLCRDIVAHIEALAQEQNQPPIDFLLTIGDDATDEAAFEAAAAWGKERPHQRRVFTSTVGKKQQSSALFLCQDVSSVHQTVQALAMALQSE
jgi:trehalose-6-phosphatase